MPDELLHLIEKVQQRLREGRYQNESAVRETIILPVLRTLGWDADDPDTLRREYAIQQARVDYALFVDRREPALLIEVKAVGSAREGDQQLFQYLYHQGTPMAVLTDGQEWDFYLPTATGSSYEDRRVQKLDLLARQTEECCQILERYLGQTRVKSGRALKDAQQDHQNNRLRETARNHLPRAWEALVQDSDEELVRLLREKTESLCGSRPEIQDVAAFVSSLRGEPAPPPPVTKLARNRPPGPTPAASKPHAIEVVLDGKRESVPTAKAGFIRIIEYLAKQDPTFLSRLATVARGNRRQYVAKRPEDMYPGHPDLQRFAHQMTNGWYLAASGDTRTKQKILAAACEVAGLRYGKDVALIVPE